MYYEVQKYIYKEMNIMPALTDATSHIKLCAVWNSYKISTPK